MSSRRFRPLMRPLIGPVFLGALLGLCAPPSAADTETGASADVAKLYAEAARTAERYEATRREADARRLTAQRLEDVLSVERSRADALRRDVGRIAREQYRRGDGLPYAVEFLTAKSPEELLRGSQVASHAGLAVDHAVSHSLRAQRRLAHDQKAADAVWRGLEQSTAALAELKQGIEARLSEARSQLESQAEQSVAAGHCRGAAPLDQPAQAPGAPWVAPVEHYRVSAGFDRAGAHWAHRHTGQDFAVPIGTPVRAAGDGRVVRVSCGGPFGIEIVVAHDNGYFTQYAHLSSPAVDQGERVRAGQWIGQSGTSGNSTGPHVHFEVRLTQGSGSAVDPVPWLAEHGVIVADSPDPEGVADTPE